MNVFTHNPALALGPRLRGLAAAAGYTCAARFEPAPTPPGGRSAAASGAGSGAGPADAVVGGGPTHSTGNGSTGRPGRSSGNAPAARTLRLDDEALGDPAALSRAWNGFFAGGAVPAAVETPGGFWTLETAPAPDPRDRNAVMTGRIAVVTGGAQGFGEEIVRGLFARGARVAAADLNRDGARRLADALNADAGEERAIGLGVDVTDDASMMDMVGELVRTWGGIDLCVANAGVLKASPVLEQDVADFEFVTRVNYTGYMITVKHCAAVMAEQFRLNPRYAGDIVQINSKSGLAGSNKNAAYSGSKFGSIGLTQSFALELVEHGIKVNSVCPGNFFDGPLWSHPEHGLFAQYLRTGKVPGARSIDDVRRFYESKVPMKRGCTGPDVLRAILYLVEQEYETGQALPVTGGQVMLS